MGPSNLVLEVGPNFPHGEDDVWVCPRNPHAGQQHAGKPGHHPVFPHAADQHSDRPTASIWIFLSDDTTATHCLLLQEIQIGFGFTFLVLVHPGSPGQNPESHKVVVVVVVVTCQVLLQ